jgi:hypothetical protein
MSGQMRTFLDQTGGLWASGALYGKLASVFSSTGTGGGQEQTITSTWTTLAHHGMVIVPIGYGARSCLMFPRCAAVRRTAQPPLPAAMVHVSQAMKSCLSPAIRVNMSRVWPKTERLTQQEDKHANSRIKAHRVGEWASLRNTSPEIAEAIFEVAKYDEKLAEQIWEEGSDEVLVRAFEKRTKTRSSGVSKPSNVKTSKRFPIAGVLFISPRYSSPH